MVYLYWVHHAYCHYDVWCEGYVGVSIDWKKRWLEHQNSKKRRPLYYALKKYGNDIVMTVLYEGTKEECYAMEKKYRPQPQMGWNISEGGKISSGFRGYQHSEASKQKTSLTLKQKFVGRKSHRWGATMSIDTRQKMSTSHLGKKLSDSVIQGLRERGCKTWIVRPPIGTKYTIKNMSQFCTEHQLNPGKMSEVARGTRKHHKGWTCSYATTSACPFPPAPLDTPGEV